jgi:uncharacterized membrane protein (DUF485 family)
MTHASSFTPAQEPADNAAFDAAFDVASERGNSHPVSGNALRDFAEIREHPDFVRVRRRLTRFVFPVSALFLAWYLTFVLLAAYAPGFMGRRVSGSVTVGLLLGLSQFVTTVAIMLWYARFAKKKVDPEIAELRRAAGEDGHER